MVQAKSPSAFQRYPWKRGLEIPNWAYMIFEQEFLLPAAPWTLSSPRPLPYAPTPWVFNPWPLMSTYPSPRNLFWPWTQSRAWFYSLVTPTASLKVTHHSAGFLCICVVIWLRSISMLEYKPDGNKHLVSGFLEVRMSLVLLLLYDRQSNSHWSMKGINVMNPELCKGICIHVNAYAIHTPCIPAHSDMPQLGEV